MKRTVHTYWGPREISGVDRTCLRDISPTVSRRSDPTTTTTTTHRRAAATCRRRLSGAKPPWLLMSHSQADMFPSPGFVCLSLVGFNPNVDDDQRRTRKWWWWSRGTDYRATHPATQLQLSASQKSSITDVVGPITWPDTRDCYNSVHFIMSGTAVSLGGSDVIFIFLGIQMTSSCTNQIKVLKVQCAAE